MTYLFADWAQASKRLTRAKARLFVFDIDGTLAPIAKTPESAHVPAAIRDQLERLNRWKNTQVGVLSGRSLAGAKKMVKNRRFIYGGNHGLEISGPGIKFINKSANRRARLFVKVLPELYALARIIPGVRIENKGLTISVHYRGVALLHKHHFKAFVRKMRILVRKNNLVITPGKKVLEIRPPVKWNKGVALAYIRRHLSPRPLVLYVGDDVTDEAAFRSLKAEDIGVRVEPRGASRAAYYLKRQSEVGRLLDRLSALQPGRP